MTSGVDEEKLDEAVQQDSTDTTWSWVSAGGMNKSFLICQQVLTFT